MDSSEISSTVRGHHVYKVLWTPIIGEELGVSAEERNDHDRHAVAVTKNEDIVGHVPCELDKTLDFYLKRPGTQATCVITGHRKYDVGLVVPCIYKVEGPIKLVKKLSKLLKIG